MEDKEISLLKKWCKICLPIFIQPQEDIDNGNKLIAVFVDYFTNKNIDNSISLYVIFESESSYNTNNKNKLIFNHLGTFIYRSFNYYYYNRTADIKTLKYTTDFDFFDDNNTLTTLTNNNTPSTLTNNNNPDFDLNINIPPLYKSIFTFDYAKNQNYLHGNRINFLNYSLMLHYNVDVSFDELMSNKKNLEKTENLECNVSQRPIIYLNTCNHMFGFSDNNKNITEKKIIYTYDVYLGDYASAETFAKNIKNKINLFNLFCFRDKSKNLKSFCKLFG